MPKKTRSSEQTKKRPVGRPRKPKAEENLPPVNFILYESEPDQIHPYWQTSFLGLQAILSIVVLPLFLLGFSLKLVASAFDSFDSWWNGYQ